MSAQVNDVRAPFGYPPTPQETTMSHSPGPWKIKDHGYTRIITDTSGWYITRDIQSGHEAVCRLDTSTMAAMARRANAYLIASAPELLEVVRQVLSSDVPSPLREAAEKALSKALGPT